MRLLTHTLLGLALGLAGRSEEESRYAGWQPMTSMMVGVSGFAHGAWGNQIYIAGGTTWDSGVKRALDATWLFHPETQTWKEHGRLPRPHANGAFAMRGSNLIIAGGTTGADARADAWSVRVEDGLSRPIGTLPQPLTYCSGILAKRSLFILGGVTDPQDPHTATDAFMSFDFDSGEIQALPPFPGGARIHAALAENGGFIYVLPGGGYEGAEGKFSNTCATWRYNIRRREWERLADYPLAVRGLAVTALNPRFFLVGGGYASSRDGDPEFTNACWIYDTEQDRFHPLAPLPYAAMQVAFIRHRDYVYMLGGEDRHRHRTKQVYRIRTSVLLQEINRLEHRMRSMRQRTSFQSNSCRTMSGCSPFRPR